ncbi:MAG: hypothetical protein HZA08_08715 [Nitrospirae bacterium]|nr:hypothetical protein [Nitrospirota bacterium]
MKNILLLATSWDPNYWTNEREASYEGAKFTDLPEWDELEDKCPLAGIGFFKKHKEKDYSLMQFVYLQINGIRYDPDTGYPSFWTYPIKRSRVTSSRLERALPEENLEWFTAIEKSVLTDILKDLGEKPPEAWMELLKG